MVLDKHFHVIIIPTTSKMWSTSYMHNIKEKKEICFGLSFAHEKVAEKFYQTVVQLMPHVSGPLELQETTSNVSNLFASCQEMVNFTPTCNLLEEEAGALTLSGKFLTVAEQIIEDEHIVDVSFGFTSVCEEETLEEVDVDEKIKNKQNIKQESKHLSKEWMNESTGHHSLMSRKASIEDIHISNPVSVKHMAHVNAHTPLHTLKEVVNTGKSLFTSNMLDQKERKHGKLHRVPSVPTRIKHSSSPTIVVTPAKIYQQSNDLKVYSLPSPPFPNGNFEDLLKIMKFKNTECDQAESCAWERKFQCVVNNLIHKKLQDDDLCSKLLSFTQSGQEQTSEKSDSRTSSIIIHDHGIVYL